MSPFHAAAGIARLRHRDPPVAMAIVALQRIAYRAEAELIGYPALPPLKESPADIMASDESFYGVTTRGRLIALISTEQSDGSTTICRLCVAPDCSRRGHGQRLVRHVLTGADGPTLVSTAEANAPAVTLYRKLGFVPERVWTTPEGLALISLRHSAPDGASKP